MTKREAFNKYCDCSDRYAIPVSSNAVCELCGRGFCSKTCSWVDSHNDKDGKPCPGRWKTKTTFYTAKP
jgi:hypothetical protein